MINTAIGQFTEFQHHTHPERILGVILPDKTNELQNNELHVGVELFKQLFFDDIVELYMKRYHVTEENAYNLLCIESVKFIDIANDPINTLFSDPQYSDRLDVSLNRYGPNGDVLNAKCNIAGIILGESRVKNAQNLITGKITLLWDLICDIDGDVACLKKIKKEDK